MAQSDLLAIQGYVARDTPATARKLIAALFDAIESLVDHPERAPAPREEKLRRLGFRVLVHRPYLVFFRIRRSEVRVYRVLHGRRAYLRLI